MNMAGTCQGYAKPQNLIPYLKDKGVSEIAIASLPLNSEASLFHQEPQSHPEYSHEEAIGPGLAPFSPGFLKPRFSFSPPLFLKRWKDPVVSVLIPQIPGTCLTTSSAGLRPLSFIQIILGCYFQIQVLVSDMLSSPPTHSRSNCHLIAQEDFLWLPCL